VTDGERARAHFLERIWEVYADYYDAYRVDTGRITHRIKRWSELSPVHKQLFLDEMSSEEDRVMTAVAQIGLDDAFD